MKEKEEDLALSLSYKNKKAIVDFLTCIPGVMTKAAPTPYTIEKGFRDNGILDEKTGCYPNFDNILGTV
jgi:hypothetical protein